MKSSGKYNFSLAAIIIVILVALTIDFSLRNWEKTERVVEHDIHTYYAYLPAYFIYDDIEFKKDDYKYDEQNYYFWYETTRDGKNILKMTMGLAIMYAPFFAAGHLAAMLFEYPLTGFSEPYKLFLLLSSAFYLFVGLYYVVKILQKYNVSDRTSAITILLLGLATNLLAYGSQSAPYSHVYNLALITVFIWLTIRYYESFSIKHACYLGFVFGMITLIRPSNAVVLLLFMLYGVQNVNQFLKKNLRLFHLVLFLCLVFIVWVPQMIYWKHITGSYLYYSYSEEQFYFLQPAILKGLFSWRKGWLLYTPVMTFALIGIFFMKKRFVDLQKATIIFTVVNFYIIMSWWCWWYGGSFGQRAMIDTYGLLAIPLSAFVDKVYSSKKTLQYAALCIGLFFIWLNIFQTFQFEAQVLHYEGMSRKLYLKQFGKMKKVEDYEKYIDYPDFKAAMKGKR